jgi:hypothetical protein
MGTDIMGWVECRRKLIDDETWEAVLNLDFVYLGRDYQAFGRLFGVRNTTKVQPIAAKRGLPADSSSQVKKEAAASGFYAHSWISWQELKTSEWEADQYWQPLMKVLEILASLYGEENVRLVVWFED